MNKQLFLRNSYLCANYMPKKYALLGGCFFWGLRKKDSTGYRVTSATLWIVMREAIKVTLFSRSKRRRRKIKAFKGYLGSL